MTWQGKPSGRLAGAGWGVTKRVTSNIGHRS